MKKQFTILLLILGILFIVTSIFYLWLLMFHLKLNPDMLKKSSCGKESDQTHPIYCGSARQPIFKRIK